MAANRKTLAELVSEHKKADPDKLSAAQKAARNMETRSTVDEIIRRNRNASPEYLKEIATFLFSEAEAKEGN